MKMAELGLSISFVGIVNHNTRLHMAPETLFCFSQFLWLTASPFGMQAVWFLSSCFLQVFLPPPLSPLPCASFHNTVFCRVGGHQLSRLVNQQAKECLSPIPVYCDHRHTPHLTFVFLMQILGLKLMPLYLQGKHFTYCPQAQLFLLSELHDFGSLFCNKLIWSIINGCGLWS